MSPLNGTANFLKESPKVPILLAFLDVHSVLPDPIDSCFFNQSVVKNVVKIHVYKCAVFRKYAVSTVRTQIFLLPLPNGGKDFSLSHKRHCVIARNIVQLHILRNW